MQADLPLLQGTFPASLLAKGPALVKRPDLTSVRQGQVGGTYHQL